MSCHIITDPKLFNGSPIFVCGPTHAIRHCRFCRYEGHRREAKALCDWPVDRTIELPWRELRIGDIWVTCQKGTHGRIVEIVPGSLRDDRGNPIPDPTDTRCATFWVKLPLHPKPYPYFRQLEQLVTTIRGKGTCDNPCCFRHRRHVGPNRDYCKDHWNAWTEVRQGS